MDRPKGNSLFRHARVQTKCKTDRPGDPEFRIDFSYGTPGIQRSGRFVSFCPPHHTVYGHRFGYGHGNFRRSPADYARNLRRPDNETADGPSGTAPDVLYR